MIQSIYLLNHITAYWNDIEEDSVSSLGVFNVLMDEPSQILMQHCLFLYMCKPANDQHLVLMFVAGD